MNINALSAVEGRATRFWVIRDGKKALTVTTDRRLTVDELKAFFADEKPTEKPKRKKK